MNTFTNDELVIIEEKKDSLIPENFASLDNYTDIVKLLNIVKVIIYGKDTDLFTLKTLTKYANPKISGDNRYFTFTIKKKSGGERIINAPCEKLKDLLQCLNYVLQVMFKPHPQAMGFVREKSVVTNAALHTNKNYVYNIDLKDFFHSFGRQWVKWIFTQVPFNLSGEREPLAFFLASLCTHPLEIDGETRIVLPQGAPTSPTLTNILCYPLDKKLNGLAKRFGATYSRYADDITFSSNKSIFKNEDFLKELYRIIESQKLAINEKKTRLQKKEYRQEVTGLIVNEKVNTYRRYVKQLRMWLYYIERYGMKKAEELFRKDYIKEKAHVKWEKNPMKNVLQGKLLYLKMVKGAEDATYLKLVQRFDRAFGFDVEAILKIWEEKGIAAAEGLYYDSKPNRLIKYKKADFHYTLSEEEIAELRTNYPELFMEEGLLQ